MRLLICRECHRTFKTPQKTYTPKYCSKPCYWQASKNPDTVHYERYKIIEENVKYLVCNIFPVVGLFVAFLVVVAFVIS